MTSLWSAGGHLYVSRDEQTEPQEVDGGVGVQGRVESRVFVFEGEWRETGGGDIDPTTRNNLRTLGLDHAGTACVTYTGHPSPAPKPPTARVRCLRDGQWRPEGPEVEVRAVDPAADFVTSDNAVAVGDTIYAGVDVFQGRSVDWQVLRLEDGSYTSTKLGASSRRWNEQGTLIASGEDLWAIQFDQRMTERGMHASLKAKRLDKQGVARTIGRPFFANRLIYGPLYYGLAIKGDAAYAAVTVPDVRRKRNTLRVFRTRVGG